MPAPSPANRLLQVRRTASGSERRAHRQRHVSRIAIDRPGIEPVPGVVMLVEQVVDVEAHRRIVGQLVLGHGIPDRVTRPVHVRGPRTHAVDRLPGGAGYRADVALCLDAGAQGEAIERAGQTIGGRGLE